MQWGVATRRVKTKQTIRGKWLTLSDINHNNICSYSVLNVMFVKISIYIASQAYWIGHRLPMVLRRLLQPKLYLVSVWWNIEVLQAIYRPERRLVRRLLWIGIFKHPITVKMHFDCLSVWCQLLLCINYHIYIFLQMDCSKT